MIQAYKNKRGLKLISPLYHLYLKVLIHYLQDFLIVVQ